MSDKTYHLTGEDVRKLESQEGKAHGGQISKDSDASILKSIIADRAPEQERIDKAQANLELPEQPPTASDWNSADGTKVNVGSGGVNVKLGTNSSSGLREPATAESAVRVDGEELKTDTAIGN